MKKLLSNVTIHARISKEDYEKLLSHVDESGTNISLIVRHALRQYFSNLITLELHKSAMLKKFQETN